MIQVVFDFNKPGQWPQADGPFLLYSVYSAQSIDGGVWVRWDENKPMMKLATWTNEGWALHGPNTSGVVMSSVTFRPVEGDSHE